ncbi:uncharacterized protein MEPE_01951 [Melanopsichium pennsylvanicum]|uniref:Uncharacterized protein n=2 Tax=Melanopsichium pennsylvanicum TaxID=63383 RepID=A0AAJ4XJC7_9BASI|nr:putative protein [Melanopsichium pennsylvanicum 4]SNX83245.1 uncharacterized protein MEPE_01951 [Melanopsichium pennsylvanicum]
MTSPLRRSTRASRNADAPTTPEPSTLSPSVSPSKPERKRKRLDEPADADAADEQMVDAANSHATDDSANHASAQANKLNGVHTNAANAESSTPIKPQLSRKIQSLLGISSSSAPIQSPNSAVFDDGASTVGDLDISQEHSQKLNTIIDTLDAAGLVRPPSRANAKGRACKPASSGFNLLRSKSRSGGDLHELRDQLQEMREPLLAKAGVLRQLQAAHSSKPTEEVAEDLARLSSLTLIIGLVEQLAPRLRRSDTRMDILKGAMLCSMIEERARFLEAKNAKKGTNTDPSDDEHDVARLRPIPPPSDHLPATRYALHMRLPRCDYFTKAIALDREQLGKLNPAQADLVQISAQSEAQMRALRRQGLTPTPTLGQRLGRNEPRHRPDTKPSAPQQLARPQPVTFLNYGNYSSFAPTYDSSASSISYATSSTLWRDSIRTQRSVSLTWGDKPFQSYDDERVEHDDLYADAPVQPAPFAKGSSGADADAHDDGDVSMSEHCGDETAALLRNLVDGVDGGDISESLDKLDQDELITSHLRFNMMLLHRLQEFQWARLRKSFAPSIPGRTIITCADEVTPCEEEEATAALLLESLSSLVALRPRAADLTSDAVEAVVPTAEKLRAFSASSGAIDPDLLGDVRDGFWGALDANVVKVTKTGGVISETPLVLRDDTTLRLAEGSGFKTRKTARRTGAGGEYDEDRGRNALERFALSRTYDHNNDRHDIEPVRAAPALGPNAGSITQGAMPSPSQRSGPPLAGSPQPRPQNVAMSPNPRMHAGYAPGPGQAMTPQPQRMVPGPNASYAFASPAGGLTYQGRPMAPNATSPYPQQGFAHPSPGQPHFARAAHQS